jgi:hypothetical protein
MSSCQELPLDTASQASAVPSTSTLPNAFGQLMQSQQATTSTAQRDRCQRPSVVYNQNYNLYTAPPVDLPPIYLPYVFREPLYNDRAVIVARLPRQHTVAEPPKKPRTAWV